MTLGEKIKKARREKKMTQAELCKGKITRNMLSAIECNKASPSLESIKYIAERLKIPVSYLLSEDDNLFFYAKREEMRYIKGAYKAKNYAACIEHINKLSDTDDELEFLLASSYFELGKASLLRGSLASAGRYLKKAKEHSERSIYDTERIKKLLPLYIALATNIQAPLLELDVAAFQNSFEGDFEIELFKYISGDTEYKYTTDVFARHIKAKRLMRDRNYQAAIALLSEIEDSKTKNYNACVIFGVYADLETCYKQLMDFEGAYRYSSKRISMIEGFKS